MEFSIKVLGREEKKGKEEARKVYFLAQAGVMIFRIPWSGSLQSCGQEPWGSVSASQGCLPQHHESFSPLRLLSSKRFSKIFLDICNITKWWKVELAFYY